MTTALLDGVRVDQITQQAREITPGRTVLSWIAAVLFAVGWITYKVFAVLWLAGAWTFVAARQGYRAAKVSRGPGRPG